MSNIPLEKHLPNTSRIVYGCMGIGGEWDSTPTTQAQLKAAYSAIDAALDAGIKIFDQADIYRNGKSEASFGSFLKQKPSLRDSIYIQSKCGIRPQDSIGPGRYDFSSQWILESVENILRRLNSEYLDVLFLHRPDPLVEMDELAMAISRLRASGKIRQLAVSNMHHHQIQQMESMLGIPIVANQLEMSLAKLDWLNDGVTVGSTTTQNTYTSGLLEYCQAKGIQLQAWGCLAQGQFSKSQVSSDDSSIQETAKYIQTLCAKYKVQSEAILIAFLLRHPAKIQPVIGTSNPERIRAAVAGCDIQFTREEWYNLFVKSRGVELP